MPLREISAMAIFSIITLAILLVKIESIEKRDNQKENKLFIGKIRKNQTLKIYNRLINNRITGSYTMRISKRYEMLYPALENVKAEKTVYSVCGLFGINCILFFLLFIMKPSLVNFAAVILIMYVVQVSAMAFLLCKAEVNMLVLLDQALSDIKHYFISCKDITTAIWLTMDNTSREISSHINELFSILESSDMNQDMREYNESMRNKYFKLLLGICVKTAEQGDSFDEQGHSIFSENISILKRDIRREVHKIRRTDFIFSGLSFVSTAPLIGLEPIRVWAVTNLTDLDKFYAGRTGFFVLVISFLITILIFQLLFKLRSPEISYPNEYRFLNQIYKIKMIRNIISGVVERNYKKVRKKQELLRRIGEKYSVHILSLRQLLYGAAGFLLGVFLFAAALQVEKNRFITSVYDLHEMLPDRTQKAMPVEDLAEWMRDNKKYGNQIFHRLREENESTEDIANNMILQDLEKLKEEIFTRFDKADHIYFKWYELLCALLISCAAYQIPYWMLMIKKQFLQNSMAEEVMCFQTILSMQVFLKGISLMDLMESMELFAKVFKPSIQSCINQIAYDEKKALEELRASEEFPPFQRLIDCFLMNEKSDIKTAFDEVVEDIKHAQDIYAFDIEVMLQKKSNMAELLAFMPGVFILAFYLAVPFIGAGLLLFETSFQDNIQAVVY